MIHVINFLPRDYLERQRRRRANLVCLGLGGVTLIAVVLVTGVVALRASGTSKMRAVVDGQYEDASRRISQLKELEKRKEGLLRKVELSASLLERVPRSLILARLTNALPPHTSFQVISMKTDKEKIVDTAALAAAQAARKKGGRPKKQARAPVKMREFLAFRIDGLAPSDDDVATLVRRLTDDAFFDDVNPEFTEEFPYSEEVTLRRFSVTFRLSQAAEALLVSPESAKLIAFDEYEGLPGGPGSGMPAGAGGGAAEGAPPAWPTDALPRLLGLEPRPERGDS